MAKTIEIGKHTASIEGDLLLFRLVDTLTLDELKTYITIAEQLITEHGRCFIIDDITELHHASPEVRRLIINWLASHACPGVALFGGSLSARTIALLVLGAMKMLGKQTFPIVFVKEEKEARDWIAAQRRKVGAT